MLFIRQHLDVSQSGGVVDDYMSFFVTGTTWRSLLATIYGYQVTDAIKAGELFSFDIDHVARHAHW